ncbi:MAG TPA: hypothetical protein VL096_11100 [Pirellulaceae bacterium]|nr:hypothetical protein [Pirellulaceae bacterium]
MHAYYLPNRACAAVLGVGMLLFTGQLLGADSTPPKSKADLIFLRVSPGYVGERSEKPFRHATEITDSVLGTAVRGNCQSDGKVSLQPLTGGKNGYALTVRGNCVTTSVGKNGPAIIHSTSTSQFVATCEITIDRNRGFVAGPLDVRANTQLKTNNVEAAQGGLIGRVVRNAAERRVAEATPEATEIAKQKSVVRIKRSVQQQIDEQLAKLNRQFRTTKLALAVLHRDLAEDARLDISDRALLLYFQSERPTQQRFLTTLPPMVAPGEIWFHASLLPPPIKQRVDVALAAGDAQQWLVSSAKMLVSADSTTPPIVIHNRYFSRHGQWLVLHMPASQQSSLRLATTTSP